MILKEKLIIILKKIIPVLIIVFIVFMIIATAVNLYVIGSVKSKVHYKTDLEGEYDYIIVLGCGIVDNQYPSSFLADRLDTAIYLYEHGFAPKILMSGDHRVDDYNEVSVMRNYVIERGVPSEAVICDDLGLSTFETMERAVRFFDIHSALIVTQKYHLARALYNAVDCGIDCEGVIAEGPVFINQPYYSAREFVARVKDFLFCIVF
ncbi:MAG: YdcF family protein [Saccharofermentans sp.]|nr:YdcF family protein [Saccharofermentans sp.]